MSQTLEKAVKSRVRKKKELNPNLQEKLVCEEVLNKLGEIKNFYKVTAKNVYWNRWRVNVWIEKWKEENYGPSYDITHSYFCTVQDNCIAKANPEIVPEKLQLGV